MAKCVFLNLTSFDPGPGLKSFPDFVAKNIRGAAKAKAKVLTGLKFVRSSAPLKLLARLQNGTLRCNVVDVVVKECESVPHWGRANMGRWQIFWNSEACFWHRLNTVPDLGALTSSADPKAAKAEWEHALLVLGAQKRGGAVPSVCSFACELSGEISCEAALKGFVELLEGACDATWPDDLRVYGNFGEDPFADGGMTIVLASLTHELDGDVWRSRFLRPKPFLCAEADLVGELAKRVDAVPQGLACRTVSGKRLGYVVLSEAKLEDRKALKAAADRFLHLNAV